MKKYILGTKQNMVQFFDENGRCFPATFLQAGPVVVIQNKTKEIDGYTAVQVGFGPQKEKNINKPQRGHFKDLGFFATVKEFRLDETAKVAQVGESIDVSTFAVGDLVEVSGISKGKGFQGVVKRHDFKGGRRSHGQKHSEREAGSIGAGGMQRVFKGLRMPGRMGGDRTTVKNLKVLGVDTTNNLLLVSGAVPGRRGTLIEVTA
jgi:large subunit ribosomal protein L3